MVRRVYERYRRPLLIMIALAVLLQSLEIALVELGGAVSTQEAFGSLMNWYALVLFIAFPAAIVWHSIVRPGEPPLVVKSADAFMLGMVSSGIIGAVSLALGVLGILVRWMVHGWSNQESVLVVGSVAGFLLVLPLGGAAGWVVYSLVRLRLRERQ